MVCPFGLASFVGRTSTFVSELACADRCKTKPRRVRTYTPPPSPIHNSFFILLQSCPAIRVYAADSLDSALDAAANAFCSEQVRVHPEKGEVCIPSVQDRGGMTLPFSYS